MKCSKKVKHSVLIFGLNVLGTCIYRKIGKVIWFQIWISDYDLLVTVQYTYSILTFFHSLIKIFNISPIWQCSGGIRKLHHIKYYGNFPLDGRSQMWLISLLNKWTKKTAYNIHTKLKWALFERILTLRNSHGPYQ